MYQSNGYPTKSFVYVSEEGIHAYKMVEDLVSQSSYHFKRLLRGHGIDKHVPVYTNKMLRIKYTVLILFTRVAR